MPLVSGMRRCASTVSRPVSSYDALIRMMIETECVGKVFAAAGWPRVRRGRSIRALDRVTLQVERGEVFGLVGPNGAGKTTLLKVLATLLAPSEGRAWVAGAEVGRNPGLVRRAVGLAAGEERSFYWRLSGRENLEFFAGLVGLAGAPARRRVAGVLGLVDLLPMAEEPVARYSTGMRQRLAIARALVGDPPVLLLDEPTRSLDPVAADSVRALIRRLARDEGKTVMLATHNLDEAQAVCHRAAVLVRGTVREVLSLPTPDGGLAGRYRELMGARA